MSANRSANMRNFARAINTPKLGTNGSTPAGSFITGTVTEVQLLAGTITCTIMGDPTLIPGIAFMDTYTPMVGDSPIFMKQGTDLIAIGTIQGASSSASWTPVSYKAGYTDVAGVGGPGMYRAVCESGDVKVQIKGSFTPPGVAGTGLAWTYPASSVWIPAHERDITIATNLTTDVQLHFDTAGNVYISDPTATSAVMDGLEYFVD